MEDTGERLIPEGHHQSLTYGEHISRYKSVTQATKSKVVLDIASGAGYGTKLISESAKLVYGIDYSKEAIAYAEKNYCAENIVYKVGDAHNIPLDDNSIDVVVSLETIEHLKDPKKFISEVKRVLKKDGQFIVSTPNDDEYIEGNEFHLHEFDLKELQTLITNNFSNAEFYYQGSYFGAGVFSQKIFENGGQWDGPVIKTFGQKGDKAIYFIAVASDFQVNKLSETTVLADAWNTKDDLARDSDNRNHIATLDTELGSLRLKNKTLEHVNKAQKIELESIKTSKGWKILSKFYTIKGKIKL